ncbi:hypothetical protein GCM10010441_67880 [Kitasatospora paracochleata]|uniref:Helix-turn-helix domain-containing protein n=1 Tax=Kitasatospora paracochleata TaxID=58354 RepID=A0ABT1J5B1_9ACTN|nr:helix-turn-helix domain-containing protein [Kitasatospora paracochleata]MCP2312624.1 hypothetical protein [Kitasatospora paracochleata]
MTDPSLREQAVHLLRSGEANAAVARRLGVPPGTVGYWKHLDRARRGETSTRQRPLCHRCHDDQLDRTAYVYLLGLYLGDGHLPDPRGRTPHLVISCDNKWPGVMDSVEQAMRAVFPRNRTCRVARVGCHDVKVYSTHLPCHFPQHGPGRKHERTIALEVWQEELVGAHPWDLIRGLIHSDGCRITNWATRTVRGEVRRHEYPRYFFTNTSGDIVRLFTTTLDAVGVEWKETRRASGAVNVSVARRDSVALLDHHVGPKC